MAPKSQVHPMPMFERKVLPPIQNIHVASASPSVATTSTQNTIPELPFHAAGTGTGKAPPVQNLPRAPKKARDSKKQIVWKWVKGLFCGCLSTATCCMFCCGCCGSIPAPHVFYDENDPEFKDCSKEEKRALHALQWVSVSGLCCRYGTTCGCCCGCCGNITPNEMVICGEAMRKGSCKCK